jgi:outer membrane protein TolC
MKANTTLGTWMFPIVPIAIGIGSAIMVLALEAGAQVMPIDTVLAMIDRRNPSLQEYSQRSRAQQVYTEGAKGWMAPMVGAGTFMTPYPGQDAMESDKGSVMISVEQSIPNGAKLRANEKYFASRSAVEDHGRAVQFNELRAQARTAYFQWVVAEKKLRVLGESDEIMSLLQKLARLRYPYNQGTLGSIYKAEGRQHEIQNMMLMTQGEIDDAALRLRALMNLPVDAPLMIDTTYYARFDANSLSADTVALRSQRSDIQQLDKSIEAMRLNQQLQQYQSKPEFRLRFDHMQPLGQGMPTQFTAMAMISIPIAPWSSKMYKSETKGMNYDIEAMKRGQDAIVLEARGMLAGMAAQLVRMERQLENYRTKIIPALRKNYEATLLAYEENRESLPVVIDAWEGRNMAELEYVEKLGSYLEMVVKYQREANR